MVVRNPVRGVGTEIHQTCTFDGLKGKYGEISFGDYCRVAEDCRFYVASEFSMGDYGVMHNNTLVQCYKKCSIGHNAWIGQNSIINATDTLTIGNNFAVGTFSQIWTHAFHGELLLGCRIAIGIPDYESKSGAVSIGDDFWGMGAITIGSGVKIGNKVIALTNSMITGDVPDNTIVGGSPAKPHPMNGDLRAYAELTETERFDLMEKFAGDFAKINRIRMKTDKSGRTITLGNREIIIHTSKRGINEDDTSYFDIVKRTYTKKHSLLEKTFIDFLLGYRARFVPE